MRVVNDRITRATADPANATSCHVHTSCGSLGKLLNRIKRKKTIRVADAKVARVQRVEPVATL
jgi:hypothetical protein